MIKSNTHPMSEEELRREATGFVSLKDFLEGKSPAAPQSNHSATPAHTAPINKAHLSCNPRPH